MLIFPPSLSLLTAIFKFLKTHFCSLDNLLPYYTVLGSCLSEDIFQVFFFFFAIFFVFYGLLFFPFALLYFISDFHLRGIYKISCDPSLSLVRQYKLNWWFICLNRSCWPEGFPIGEYLVFCCSLSNIYISDFFK